MTSTTTVRKTCQCCGRSIGAKRGVIAAHGYRRPGYGWQTRSCMGAGYAPYEGQRDRLGLMLRGMRKQRESLADHLQTLEADAPGTTIMVELKKGDLRSLTAATFNEFAEEHPGWRMRNGMFSWDRLRSNRIWAVKQELRALDAAIAEHMQRYDEWKAP